MKKRTLILAVFVGCSALLNAGLTHRYTFDSTVYDTVGIEHGSATIATTNLEAPQYVADAPANLIAGAPTKSLEVGMNYGTKKSGVTFSPAVISSSAGSYSLWIKADTLASGRYLIASLPLVDGPTLIGNSTSEVKVIAGDEKSPVLATFSTGTWHHVVATWDNPAGTVSLYLDGALIGSNTFTPNSITPTTVRIGGFSMNDNASNLVNQFEGQFYDLQFYDHELAAADVSDLHANPGGVYTPPVLAHRYTFESDAQDRIGGIDGNTTTATTNTEAPLYSSVVPAGAVSGAPAQSMEVGMSYGTKKSGFEVDESIIDLNQGAYSLWMKADVMSNGDYIFAPLPLTSGPILFGQSASEIKVIAGQDKALVTVPISANTWHHVVVSWDNPAGEFDVYLDGSLVGSNSFIPNTIAPTTFRIGGYNVSDDGGNFTNQYDGHLYDIQFYDGLLDSDDVLALYQNPGSHVDPDDEVPAPDPASFDVAPVTLSATSVGMTATEASDATTVEYYFEETSGNSGGDDSGWQTNSAYTDEGLTTGLQYSYTVTMRDVKGNLGSASSASNVTAQAVTSASVSAVQSGDWSDTATWGGSLPAYEDSVTIPMGVNVTLDGDQECGSITVMGTLTADPAADCSLHCDWVMVMGAGSAFEVGSNAVRYPHQFTLTLKGLVSEANPGGMGSKFLGAMNGGTVAIHGPERVSWTQLSSTSVAGSYTLTLEEAVDWKAGERIVITSTDLDWEHAEERTIAWVSADGLRVNLTQSLDYTHTGETETHTRSTDSKSWTIELKAEVGLLSRDVTIQGDAFSELDGFGGHTMAMDTDTTAPGALYIEGAELYRLGQTGVMGRYPAHWHLLTNQAQGQYVRNSSIHHSFSRAVTIHGTDYITVEDNFCYDHIGHGIFFENGAERFNVIRDNVVLLTRRPAQGEELTPSDNEFDVGQNRTPASFWITNPNNTIEDNIAAGTQGTGFWFIFPNAPLEPAASLAYYAGAEPSKEPLGKFDRNTAHSCMSGLDINDKLRSDHSIQANGAWDNDGPFYFNDCAWYSNDVAIYAGIGARKENVVYYNNTFSDNLINVFLATYQTIAESMLIADSGHGNLLGSDTIMYRLYDGAGKMTDNHMVGWDAANASILQNIGAAIKHPNHQFSGFTWNHAGTPRNVHPDFDILPSGFIGDNDLNNPIKWAQVVYDIDGSVSGTPDSSLISNHPFLVVGDEAQPANWENNLVSPHRFAQMRTLDRAVPISVIRSKPGTSTEGVYYLYGAIKFPWHQLPFIVNEDFLYTYAFESLPASKQFQFIFDDTEIGDTVLVRVQDFGLLTGLSVSTGTSHGSLASLEASSSTGYYVEPSGDLYLKFVSTQLYNNSLTVTWTSAPSWSLLDTDLDGISDLNESIAGTDPFAFVPVADAQSVNVSEDGSLAITLTGFDLNNDSLTYTLTSFPTSGSLLGTAPNLTYIPTSNFNGVDSFTFTVNDGALNSVAATVFINVIALNDMPVANAQSVNVLEDASLAITLTASDIDGDSLSYSIESNPTHGSLSGTAPNVVYTSNADYSGADSFSFKVNDGTEESAVVTITITVDPDPDAHGMTHRYTFDGNVNDASGSMDAIASIDGSLGNSHAPVYTSDVPPGVVVGAPAQSMEVGIDGKKSGVQLDPGAIRAVAGSLSFWFNADTISGGKYLFAALPPANGLIVFGSYTPGNIDMKCFDGTTVTTPISLGTWHHVTVTWDAASGTSVFYFDGNLLGSSAFTNPIDPYFGVRVGGYNVLGDPASLPANQFDGKLYDLQFYDAPLSNSAVASLYSKPGSFVTIVSEDMTHRYEFDNDVDDLTGSLNGEETTMTTYTDAVVYSTDVPAGTMPSSPTQSLELGMSAGTKKSGFELPNSSLGDQGTITLWVKPESLANGDYLLNLPGGLYLAGRSTTTMGLSDGGWNWITASVSTGAWTHIAATWDNTASTMEFFVDGVSIGAQTLSSPVTSIYTLRVGNYDLNETAGNMANQYQGKLYDLQIFDQVLSAQAVVELVANPGNPMVGVAVVNAAPLADAQTVNVNEDDSLAITLTGSDADGDPLSYSVSAPPANGSLSGTAPNLTYTPDGNYNGADSFTFIANDGTVDSLDTTVSITVNAQNDLPSADAQAVNVDEGSAVALVLTSSDLDGDSLSFSVVTGPASGSLSGTAPNLTYTPNLGFSGADSFSFVANDGIGDSPAATVNVTVNAALPAIRVTEYYLSTGDFTGTTATLTLDQNLAADYYILVRGSRDGNGSSYPNNDYARVSAVPGGRGDLPDSGASNQLTLQRQAADLNWEGVITIIECGNSASTSGFRLVDAKVTNMTTTSGTVSSAAWTDINQVVLFGGYRGGGVEMFGAPTGRKQGTGCYTRLYPSGSNTLNWSRDAGGETMFDATMTTFVIEWGSDWTVQHVNIAGSAGGGGADATTEYTTAAITTVNRANTWVWATGTRVDSGIGDSSESCLITLGDGVTQNSSESTVAIGSEYSDAYDFDVYVLTHPDIAVDHRFKVDGDSAIVDLAVTVDSTTSGARFGWVTNGCNGTGSAFPRPRMWSRYTADGEITISRGYSGQNFPAWIQAIDLSGVNSQ